MGNGIQKKINLKSMNKILIYFMFTMLQFGVIISYANENYDYFYIPNSRLYSLKELAINGDKNAAYKLARHYDFHPINTDSAYKASLWYYIAGLLGQKNGYWRALESLNTVSPIQNKALVNFSDFLKVYPKEKFNLESDCPKLLNLLMFLYYSKYSEEDKNYETLKKYLLDNGVNINLFLEKNFERYLHDDFYLPPEEISAMENLALRGNLRAALELFNFSNSYPTSYVKYRFLWDYVYNVIRNGEIKNINSLFPQEIRRKYGINKVDDIFLLLFCDTTAKSNKSMLSIYILYKYYDIIGNSILMEKYKEILKSDGIDNRLLLRYEYKK